jgi:hypothetical protein
VTRATDLYATLSPHVSAFVAEARKMSEPDAQKAVADRLRGLVTSARSNASTALQGALAASSSFAAGMPSRLSIKVYELSGIETIADAKGALGLAEITACRSTIEQLGEAYKANQSIDLAPGLALVDDLLRKAGLAVDAFDASETAVRPALELCQSAVRDVERSIQARGALVTTLHTTVITTTAFTSTVDAELAQISEVVALAEADFNAGKFADAAIKLSGKQAAAEALLGTCERERETLQRQIDRPESLRARLGAYVQRAIDNGVWTDNQDLGERRDKAKAFLDARPCDVTKAELAINVFRDAVDDAIANKPKD